MNRYIAYPCAFDVAAFICTDVEVWHGCNDVFRTFFDYRVHRIEEATRKQLASRQLVCWV